MFKTRLRLRGQLILLVAAAVLPLIGLSLYRSVEVARMSLQQARTNLQLSASLSALRQEQVADSAEQLLKAISSKSDLSSLLVDSSPANRTPARLAACTDFLHSLQQRFPIYATLGIASLDGTRVCSSRNSDGNISLADRRYFKEAVAGKKFVVGEHVIGRQSNVSLLPFAIPFINDQGAVTGVAYAVLTLPEFANALERADIPSGASLTVFDRAGTVLATSTYATQPPGRVTSDPWIKEMVAKGIADVDEHEGADGVDRVYAFAPAMGSANAGIVVVQEIPRHLIAGAGRSLLLQDLVFLLIAAAIGLFAAWKLGGRTLVLPALALMRGTRRIQRGELDYRIGHIEGLGEFSRIGRSVNQMADALQKRQTELQDELVRSVRAYSTLDLVINGMQEGLMAIDAFGRCVLSNDAARKMFAVDKETVPIIKWAEHFGIYVPDTDQLCRPEDLPMSRALRGERGSNLDLEVKHEGVRHGCAMRCSYSPMSTADGVPAALIVFADITELREFERQQKQSVFELRDMQRRLTAAHRIGRIGHFEVDMATNLVVWSGEIHDIFGVKPNDFDGTLGAFMPLLHPADKEHFNKSRIRARETNGTFDAEYRIVKPSGEVRWLHQVVVCNFDGHGKPVSRSGVVQDVTDRKLNELENAALLEQVRELNADLEKKVEERTAELLRQEALFRELAEQAPQVVWTADPQGRMNYVNRAWYELVGDQAPGDIGSNWSSFIHPDDIASITANWQTAITTNTPYVGMRRLRSKTGEWHTMSYRATPVFAPDGKVDFWVGIDADVTEIKAIETALRLSNQELEAFSYTVSHDLRSPLNTVDGFSRLLMRELGGGASAKTQHYLSRIQAGVATMGQLIEDLLSLAQLSRMQLRHEPVSLTSIGQDILERLQSKDPDRVCRIEVAPDMNVLGDRRLISVALENLLGNAWKFAGQKEVCEITFGRMPSDSGEAVFFVKDNGAGFDMAYADKLFNIFQRLHSASEFPGSGVGLATVSRVVGRHNGRVWARSTPGEGATFFFTLGDTLMMPNGPFGQDGTDGAN